MQITVFGASGHIGGRVVELALKRGYTVVAFVHHRELFVPNNRLIIVKGDIHDPAAVAKAIKGSDAVISCLGSWHTKTRDIVSSAARELIPAMKKQGIKRIVTLTGSGAAWHNKPVGSGHKLFLKVLSPLPVGKVFIDGEQHIELLAASKLDWTTIRSPAMVNWGGDSYVLHDGSAKLFDTISRQAVATCLLDQIDSTEHIYEAPIIYPR
jgi:putative NADH-flavin reductase